MVTALTVAMRYHAVDWFLQARHRLGVQPGYFSSVASDTAKSRPQLRQANVGTNAI